ncbi:MAG: hypothetical protein ACKVP3_06070 [Hyphomicrobiaceae bacterium]
MRGGRHTARTLGCVILLALAAGVPGAASATSIPAFLPRRYEPPARQPTLHELLTLAQMRGQTALVINVGTLILAEPANETPLPIQIGPADALPKNTFVRIRGLPTAVSLSEGHSIAPGAWAVPFGGLPTLRITVPVGLSGRSEIVVALVTVEGVVLTEAKSTLVIATTLPGGSDKPEPQPKTVASIGPSVSTTPDKGATGSTARTTPPQGPAAPIRTEEQRRAFRFIATGNELLGEGDIATARLYYQRAVDAGLHEGALAMAASFDPTELGRLGARGLQGDTQAARRWYERARELGAPEAAERLRRLGER